jgi:DNA-directed RNA polymerase subunit RPC12/RpoP
MSLAIFGLGAQELLIGAVLVVPVAALVVYLLVRSGRGKAQDESLYHFRCTTCRRRLRYHARQAGHTGKCSNCGHQVTFPPVSESID